MPRTRTSIRRTTTTSPRRWILPMLVVSLAFLLIPFGAASIAAQSGSPPQPNAPKSAGNALQFDGSDDFVSVADTGTFDFATSLTLEAWLKPNAVTGPTAYRGLISGRSSDTPNTSGGWVLYTDNDDHSQWGLSICTPNCGATLAPAGSLVQGQWTHVAATYDGAAITLYQDGVQIGSTAKSGDVSDVNYLIIGAWNLAFDGIIDEVRVWNVARSQSEIQAAMDTSLSGTESGLVGYWRLDTGSGQTAVDSSIYTQDGRLGSTTNADSEDPAWVTSDAPISPSVTPTFELTPDWAGLGALLQASGCDWQPGETVEIWWDDPAIQVASATADAAGCFDTTFVLPDAGVEFPSPDGGHKPEAQGAQSGTVATTFQQTTQQLQIDPYHGPPTLPATLSGCGWGSAAGQVVNVFRLDTGDLLGKANVVTDGGTACLDGSLTFPDTRQADTYVAVATTATDLVTGTGTTASAFIVGLPEITLTPDSGPPNTHVPVTGCYWFPGETVSFTWQSTGEAMDFPWDADASGCLTYPGSVDPYLIIPSTATSGEHTVRATGGTSGLAVNTPFTVIPRELNLSPDQGSWGGLINISGCGWGDNAHVDIEWGYPDTNNQPIIWRATVNTTTGCYNTNVAVPNNTPGGVIDVTATGSDAGTAQATFSLIHPGTVEIPDVVVEAGETTTVYGSEWAFGETVLFYWPDEGPTTSFDGTVVGVSGAFTYGLTLPTYATPGQHTIEISGTKGGFDTHGIFILDGSEITTSPSPVYRGQSITVNGTGWGSGEVIDVVMSGNGTYTLGETTVPAGQTSFSAGFTVPTASRVATYTLTATGDKGREAETVIEVGNNAEIQVIPDAVAAPDERTDVCLKNFAEGEDVTFYLDPGRDYVGRHDDFTFYGSSGAPYYCRDIGTFRPDYTDSTGSFTLIAEGSRGSYATTAVSVRTDLVIDAVEVTQATQDLNNSVRLVADKRTYVRVHTHSTAGIHRATAELDVSRPNVGTQTLIPINSAHDILVGEAPDRAVTDDAFLFELPPAYNNGTVDLTARVNPVGAIPPVLETTQANNDMTEQVTFEDVPSLNLVIYRVGYTFNNVAYTATMTHARAVVDWLEQAYPVWRVNARYRTYNFGTASVTTNSDGDTVTNPDCGDINSYLANQRALDEASDPWVQGRDNLRYLGLVDDGGFFMRGCSGSIPSEQASGPTGPSAGTAWTWDPDGIYGDWYAGHELGHTFGRYHAEFCGAIAFNDKDEDGVKDADEDYPDDYVAYPYTDGRISPSVAATSNRAIFGFNIDTRDVYDDEWRDVMTYCDDQWIGDWTYEALMDAFQSTAAQALGVRAITPQAEGDYLLVSGAIDPETRATELQPLYVIEAAGAYKARVPGDYAIVLRGAGGAELARYAFTPIEAHSGPPAPDQPGAGEITRLMIEEMVPFPTGTAEVAIEGPDGEELASVQSGAAAPEVTVTSPNGGEVLNGPTITLDWTADDADGDDLTYLVQVSPDGGASWLTLAANLTETGLTVDAAAVPGTEQGLVRVLATDGVNSTTDTSDGTFTVADTPASVTIVSPSGATTILESQTLTLEAEAYDPDYVTVPDDAVTWRSNLDDTLGTGAQLATATLSPGTHTITVEVEGDAAGDLASDSVQVTVTTNPASLPAPPDALVVDPEALTLNATGGYTRSIAILNQNASGALAWQADADAAWIRLSSTGGTTPAELDLGVDLDAAGPGTETATVTITSNAGTETVQVTAQPAHGIYLPLVMR